MGTQKRRHISVKEVVDKSSVLECLQNKTMDSHKVQMTEYAGCVRKTPYDMKSETCMDAEELLEHVLGRERLPCACTYTSKGHTIAFGKNGDEWWIFDSLSGAYIYDTVPTRIKSIMQAADSFTQYSSVVFITR